MCSVGVPQGTGLGNTVKSMAAFHFVVLWSSLVNFSLSHWLGCTSLIELHECSLLAEPLQWTELNKEDLT